MPYLETLNLASRIALTPQAFRGSPDAATDLVRLGADLVELVEAATVARNHANANGDYAAPYVDRLTAALAPFPRPWATATGSAER